MKNLARFSSERLLVELHALVGYGRRVEAELLACIAEVDARQLYLAEGCSSMFGYCVEVLHLTQASAYKRIRAARATRKFSALIDAVRAGELHVTAVGLIAPHLTEENIAELIGLARHRTRDEIERRLADRKPKQAVATSVRRAADSATEKSVTAGPATAGLFDQPRAASDVPASHPTGSNPIRAPKGIAEPLGNERYCVRFTATPELHRQLRELSALMRHQIPDGDLAKILAVAVDRLHKQVRQRKFAETDKPRTARASNRTLPARQIPAAIRRAVAKRDADRCTFTGPNGRRCTSREFLEFHHLTPWARVRAHSVDGITLRCRAHNVYQAECDFGAQHMAHMRTRPRESCSTGRGG